MSMAQKPMKLLSWNCGMLQYSFNSKMTLLSLPLGFSLFLLLLKVVLSQSGVQRTTNGKNAKVWKCKIFWWWPDSIDGGPGIYVCISTTGRCGWTLLVAAKPYCILNCWLHEHIMCVCVLSLRFGINFLQTSNLQLQCNFSLLINRTKNCCS